MFQLKSLAREGIPRALEKAHRYRLLAEPEEAESICLDVLGVEPDNQEALVTLILALTDPSEDDAAARARRARELLPRLSGEFERLYYEGIICERQGRAALRQRVPGMEHSAYEWLRRAMALFESAQRASPPENQDPILRWNSCARTIERRGLAARPEDRTQPSLE